MENLEDGVTKFEPVLPKFFKKVLECYMGFNIGVFSLLSIMSFSGENFYIDRDIDYSNFPPIVRIISEVVYIIDDISEPGQELADYLFEKK